MAKETKPTFEEFVKAHNDAAPSTLLAKGLGISPDDFMSSQTHVQIAVDEVLEESQVPSEERGSLRDLLMQQIAPYLRDENGAGAKSMLDVITLGLTDDASIKVFLKRQGVDLDQPEDLEYANRVLKEAILCYEEEIGRIKMNTELKKTNTPQGIYRIFKIAAGQERQVIIPQACALLRIAAVINYMERDPRIALLQDAEKALEDIVRRHIKREERKFRFVTGVPGDLPMHLANFELRTKHRRRIILKLLHKPSNKADEVLDHIGFRITTHNPLDTLRLIYQMFFHPHRPIFPSTYIEPDKSKNLLLDPLKILDVIGDPDRARELVESLSEVTINHAELTSSFDAQGNDNPHSSGRYRAIHIVFELPIVTARGERRLFPIEIQILDRQTSLENLAVAPHEDYVARQMRMVRERVLNHNLLSEYVLRIRSTKKKK